jgi:hypothetical protein
VSCPQTTCWQGNVESYTVTVNGSTQTVAAAAGGAATQVTVSNLSANTAYTAVVTALDAQKKTTGPPAQVSLTTMGPPIVNSVAVSAVTVGVGAGAEVDVTPTVNPGGEALSSCTVTITLNNGGGSGSGTCGSAITIGVPMYNTSYTATVTAKNNDGQAAGSGSGTSSLKALTADASGAFGSCADTTDKFCGGNSNLQPTAAFTNSTTALVTQGSTVYAGCQTTGGVDHGTVAYTSGSNVWLYIKSSPAGAGYMSNIWFPDPATAASGLPTEASC